MKKQSNFQSSIISTVVSWLNPFKATHAKSEAKIEDRHNEGAEKILAEYESMNAVLAKQLYEAEQVLLKLQPKPSLVRTYTLTQSTTQNPSSSRPPYLSEKEWQSRRDEEISEYRDELVRENLVAESACQSLEEVKKEAYKHLEHKATDIKSKKS